MGGGGFMSSGGDAGQEVTGLQHDILLWLSGTTEVKKGCRVGVWCPAYLSHLLMDVGDSGQTLL